MIHFRSRVFCWQSGHACAPSPLARGTHGAHAGKEGASWPAAWLPAHTKEWEGPHLRPLKGKSKSRIAQDRFAWPGRAEEVGRLNNSRYNEEMRRRGIPPAKGSLRQALRRSCAVAVRSSYPHCGVYLEPLWQGAEVAPLSYSLQSQWWDCLKPINRSSCNL